MRRGDNTSCFPPYLISLFSHFRLLYCAGHEGSRLPIATPQTNTRLAQGQVQRLTSHTPVPSTSPYPLRHQPKVCPSSLQPSPMHTAYPLQPRYSVSHAHSSQRGGERAPCVRPRGQDGRAPGHSRQVCRARTWHWPLLSALCSTRQCGSDLLSPSCTPDGSGYSPSVCLAYVDHYTPSNCAPSSTLIPAITTTRPHNDVSLQYTPHIQHEVPAHTPRTLLPIMHTLPYTYGTAITRYAQGTATEGEVARLTARVEALTHELEAERAARVSTEQAKSVP
jgi:hypothetical protein